MLLGSRIHVLWVRVHFFFSGFRFFGFVDSGLRFLVSFFGASRSPLQVGNFLRTLMKTPISPVEIKMWSCTYMFSHAS